MSDPTSGRTLELAAMRRQMDHVQQERLGHLETKLDELDSWVRSEIRNIDIRNAEAWEIRGKSLSDDAANKAVKIAFSHLGVDVDNPTELQNFRDDLRFGGVFRQAMSRSFMAVIAAIFGGIGFSLWLVFKDKFGIK